MIFIKKIIISVLLISILLITILLIPNNKNKITIAEVTHSPFYTPFYIAIENGYFKEENIDIELILTPGADKVSSAVLSGNAQIGLAGCESALYIYLNGEKDYLVAFSGLTKRDGQFMIGRNNHFNWHDLEGKEIIVGRKGGMPALSFEKALDNAKIDKSKVKINYSIDYASLSGAFISGIGDYVNLFEPNATTLEKEGYGYILESIGKKSIEMPYTVFYTKKSYYHNNKELFKSFNKAIQKGLDYTNSHTPEEIAKLIHNQFKENSLEELTTYITNYKNADSWLNTTKISKELFNNLEDLLYDNKLINKKDSYKEIIINHE